MGMLFLLSVRFNACISDDGRLRDFYQERGISHCLSGNCMQGQGKVQVTDTLIYEGHFDNYLPDGEGSLYEGDKLIYSGNWDYGHPSGGQGVITYAAREDGTQAPTTGKMGPHVKDYGDQGFWNVVGAILTCHGNRTRQPRRY